MDWGACKESFKMFDPAEILCGSGTCQWRDGFNLYYNDDDHLSVYGASLLSGRLNDLFPKI